MLNHKIHTACVLFILRPSYDMKTLCIIVQIFNCRFPQIITLQVVIRKRIAAEIFFKSSPCFPGKCWQGFYKLRWGENALAGFELLQNILHCSSFGCNSVNFRKICRNLANLTMLTGPLFWLLIRRYYIWFQCEWRNLIKMILCYAW